MLLVRALSEVSVAHVQRIHVTIGWRAALLATVAAIYVTFVPFELLVPEGCCRTVLEPAATPTF